MVVWKEVSSSAQLVRPVFGGIRPGTVVVDVRIIAMDRVQIQEERARRRAAADSTSASIR